MRPNFPTIFQKYSSVAGVALLLVATLTGHGEAQTARVSHARPADGTHKSTIPVNRPVDYDRDVRPIIAENCFACHGFDANKRMAGLRLDQADGAIQKLASGHAAIIPGDARNSPFVRRILATDATQMPPASSGKKLKPAQIVTLQRWIAQGAHYSQHWAFVSPKRPSLPPVSARNAAWVRNPIDRFILARMERAGLSPSPEADKTTLIRRVTLDLTGIPPTPQEVDAFLADKSPNAYDKMVDRLLANPHYGERMALNWLDLARFADTHGYHIDSHRDMWRWRDWVIDAFNTDLPYDQFVTQQLAGDLLPNATIEQKIASGFNRNHPINFEGGAIPDEYAAAYIFDRIDTTATAFMGLTMRCAQCHNHKYDPISQRDYYRMFALFHNVPEVGLDGTKGNAVPFLKAPTPEQTARQIEIANKLTGLDNARKNRQTEAMPAFTAWLTASSGKTEKPVTVLAGLIGHYPLDETSGNEIHDGTNVAQGAVKGRAIWTSGKLGGAFEFDGNTHIEVGTAAKSITLERNRPFSYGAWVFPTSMDSLTVLSRMNDGANFRGYDMYIQAGKVFVHLIHAWEGNAIRVNTKTPISLNQWHHLFATYDGSSKAHGLRIYVDGKPAELDYTHDNLTETIQSDVPFTIGRRTPGAPFKGKIDDVRLYDRELSAAEVGTLAGADNLQQLLAIPEAQRTEAQKAQLLTYYLENQDTTYQKLTADLNDWKRQQTDLENAIPTTMVMQEMDKPRDSFILIRGQYDKQGEKVTPGLPDFLPALGNYSPNRLGFAQWLTNPAHPLTSRVAVNRYWQMLFGTGLVKTAEDFGTQGERPSHPELLDWLATEYSGGQREQGTGNREETEKAQAESQEGRKPGNKREQGRDNQTATSATLTGSVLPLPQRLRAGDISSKSEPDKQARVGKGAGELGWSTKALIRLIVTSATYRQSSHQTPQLREKDPENRLLARGPRFRLQAELIRDQALAVSGLLVPKIGGPSVRPYQPPGLWEELAFGGGFSAQSYQQDHGDNLYRRGMYTFWKRTVPPASLQIFDAPEREFCMVRRSTTNTPLQALTLMNDPTYVEASRKLAERILTEGGSTTAQRLNLAYRLCVARPSTAQEQKVLTRLLTDQLVTFRADPKAAEKLLAVGESKRNEKLDAVELAAWTIVASTILNLDEAITKN